MQNQNAQSKEQTQQSFPRRHPAGAVALAIGVGVAGGAISELVPGPVTHTHPHAAPVESTDGHVIVTDLPTLSTDAVHGKPLQPTTPGSGIGSPDSSVSEQSQGSESENQIIKMPSIDLDKLLKNNTDDGGNDSGDNSNLDGSTDTTTTTTIEVQEPKTQLDFNTLGKLPETVKKKLEMDTLYTGPFGCSAWAIRDASGKLVGTQTAEHCGFQSNQYSRVQGSDGQTYANMPYNFVRSGNSLDNMHDEGTFSAYFANEVDDVSRDGVIGVMNGADPQEVLRLAQEQSLSPQEVEALTFGTPVVFSDWPGYQPDNKNPDGSPATLKRQTFQGFILGTEKTPVLGSPEEWDVMWVAVQKSTDGARCTPGASGGRGNVIVSSADGGTDLKGLGTQSIYVDLEGYRESNPDIQKHYENLLARMGHNISLDNVSALCGFSYIPPTGENLVHVVTSLGEIPDHFDALEAQAKLDVMNPDIPRRVLDAEVIYQTWKTSTDIISQPVISYQDDEGNAILTWVDDKDQIQTWFVPNFMDLQVVGDTPMGLVTSHIDKGAVEIIHTVDGHEAIKGTSGTFGIFMNILSPNDESTTTTVGSSETSTTVVDGTTTTEGGIDEMSTTTDDESTTSLSEPNNSTTSTSIANTTTTTSAKVATDEPPVPGITLIKP